MNKALRKITELLANLNFFQIWVFADYEIDGKIVKDYEQKNNDSILTPENWEQHEVTFFTQRMATYKESYTLSEKIKLELSGLEKLPINKTDYQVLKGRYKRYLEQKQALPPKKNNAPQAPELGFFCSLIHRIGIDKKDETESAIHYCQRVCAKFKLDYTDRVRQNYNNSETKKLRKDLIEKVLPLIDNETKVLVENYLDNKQPLNQNLHA